MPPKPRDPLAPHYVNPPKPLKTKPKPAKPKPNKARPGAKGRGTNRLQAAASPAAYSLAAKMIEACADPDFVAENLGSNVVRMAESLLAGAEIKGPAGVASLGMVGRILGASWSGPRVEAAGRAERNSVMLDRLEAALAARKGEPGHVSVTSAPAAAAQLPWDKGFGG